MGEFDKAAGQIIVESARDFRAFISRIFGPPADEVAAAFLDQVKYWRYRNLLLLADKVEALQKSRNTVAGTMRALPFGDAYKVIEAASEEEDESVQDLWANLIANASEPGSNISIKKVHIDLLKSISGVEVAVLKLVAKREGHFSMEGAAKTRYSDEEEGMAIENLIRLRCIAIRTPISNPHISFPPPRISSASDVNRWLGNAPQQITQAFRSINDQLSKITGSSNNQKDYSLGLCALTPLGRSLMEACSETVTGNQKT
jgi:hypothetical protein